MAPLRGSQLVLQNPYQDLKIISDQKDHRPSVIYYSSFDFIITDIIGVKFIKKYLGSDYDHQVECKLRVLDSFGTDEILNRKNCSIEPNDYGKLGLNLKQFWTFYPHNKPGFGYTRKAAISYSQLSRGAERYNFKEYIKT